MNYKLGVAKNKILYHRELFISKTIAGFIILSTGIIITLKGIWMTSPLGTSTWGIILLMGMMLIIIGAITISYRG